MATLERSQEVTISDLLSVEVIASELEVSSRDDVFEELISMLGDNGQLDDTGTALKAIREREDILSTGIGNGVAIPHAKTEAVESLVATFGRVPEGVDFQSLDGEPAHLIFLLLSPEDEAGLHVRALARISRMLKNTEFRERMLNADDAEEIYSIIQEEEEHQ